MIRWRESSWLRECTVITRRGGVYVKYAAVMLNNMLGKRTIFKPVQISIPSDSKSQHTLRPLIVRKVICNLLYGWKKV